jgi:XTP/dITP diphosphohydrolase
MKGIMKNTIYYVTGNHGKFEEVRDFIKTYYSSIQLLQADIQLTEEQTLDQKKIAHSKAKQAWKVMQKPLLVDDSGIYFEKYNDFPGTMTKFVCQAIGFDGIFRLMDVGDKAVFLLQMVYMENENSTYTFEGRCDGVVVKPSSVRSHPQLPYDEIFLPNGSDKTYAQMRNTKEIHKFAYRLLALKKFIDWYSKR